MNDDELTRLFRSLEEQAEPDQAFNESLFARLEREAHVGSYRRRTSARWVLLAAALLVAAAVGAAAAVGSGLIKFPIELAVASPTPSPSASTSESATPIPSATASASATPLPIASIPEGTGIGNVIATHDGFLAIGSAGSGVNVLLHAPSDASTWQPVDDPGFGRIINAAAGTSSEIILTNTSQELSGKYMVWRSTDGQHWNLDSAWTADASTAPLVTAGGPAGFLILGSSGPASNVWTSSDGQTWTHGSIAPDIGGAAVVNGGFLATSLDGKIYASVNGVAWQAVSSPVNASGNEGITRIFMVGSNVVALICQQQLEPASCSIWTSSLQGSAGSLSMEWRAASDAQLMNGYSVTAAAGTTRGFMWGYNLSTYGRVAWTSSDGIHWSRSALADAALGAGMPTEFAAGASAEVAVGWTESNGVGVGGELWQSADGISWTPANAPLVPPPPQVPGGACPAAPTTLQQLVDIGPFKAASCFGQASLTVRAYSSQCHGCGGTGFPRHSPDWIANAYASAWYVSTTVTTSGGPGTTLRVWPSPTAHLTLPPEGTPLELTGHFNDPVSPDCRIIPIQVGTELPPLSVAEAGCRQAFVVTSFKVAGG